MHAADTIAAIATAPGRGGIGVVRVSGPAARAVACGMLGRAPRARLATHAAFLDACGEPLDDGIALWFDGPASYTGEDVLELQGHGGPQVLDMVLARCLELGARLAEPGEFSRRAYLNGKLDLAQAEAVADLIDAQSQAAARCVLRSLRGEFSERIHALVQGLTELRMRVEAAMDFPEEGIDFMASEHVEPRLDALSDALDAVLEAARQGALLREGMRVVLIGQPNVGKSSLLNRLAGHEAAIVTEIAGTTRDTVRELIQIDGVPLHAIDTAGLRDTDDPVEKAGIARTWAAIEQADAALLLVDAAHGVGAREAEILAKLPDIPRLTLHNKIDLTGEPARFNPDSGELWLSALSGAGIELLCARLLHLAGWHGHEGGTFMARARHLEALRAARGHLLRARGQLAQPELCAEELRLAQDSLTAITGAFSADDLLGEIFSRFCIGK
jgi:tRNA modification GTPase